VPGSSLPAAAAPERPGDLALDLSDHATDRPPARRRARPTAAQRRAATETERAGRLLGLPRGEGPFAVADDGTIIFPDGSCAAAISVGLTNFFSLGAADQERAAYAYNQFLTGLSPGQLFQVIVESDPLPPDRVLKETLALVTTTHPARRRMATAALAHHHHQLRNREVPAVSAYALIGPAPEAAVGLAAGLEGVARAAGVGRRTREPDRASLQNAVDDATTHLAALELAAAQLRRDETLALLWRCVNPGRPQPRSLAEVPAAGLALAVALAPDAWAAGYDTVRTASGGSGAPGGSGMSGRATTYARSFYLLNVPARTSPASWLADIIALGCRFRLSLHYEGTDRFRQRSRLLKRRKRTASRLATTTGPVFNLDDGAILREAEEQAEALDDPEVGLVRLTAVVTLLAESPEALDVISRRAERALRMRWGDTGLGRGPGLQGVLWRASLPLNRNAVRRRSRLVRGETAGNGFAFISHNPGMDAGVPVGYAARGGGLTRLDLFSPTLANGVVPVLGKVHSGKTYFAQIIAEWELFQGGRVAVIDQGPGFRTLCDAADGVYVAPSKAPPAAGETVGTINIWDYRSPEERGGKLSFLKAAHEIMLSRPGERLGDREKGLLDVAIRHVYARHPADHPDGPIPLERELVALLEAQAGDPTRPETERELLATMTATLGQYVGEGEHAHLIDRVTTVDVDAALLAFNLGKVSSTLYALLMLTIVDVVTRRAEQTWAATSGTGREMLVIDEGWWVTRYSTAGEWLDQLARRARHIGLALLFLTQQLSDLTDNEIARGIFNAASVKCLFQQVDIRTSGGKSVVEWLAEALQISPEEARELTNLPAGRMMLVRTSLSEPTRRGLVDVRASQLEYWTFTSKRSDLAARAAAIAAAGGDVLEALLALAGDADGHKTKERSA